jgi:hypothetical protein
MMANMKASFKTPERTYRLLALTALGVGLLVYLLDRSPAHVYFLSRVTWWISSRDSRLGALGGSLPDLLHVYAFILLTAAVAPKRNTALPICVFWLLLDALFELGQHSIVAPRIAAAVPAWFHRVPFLDNTASYFLHGTFDYADLLAIAAGAVFAYGSISLVQKHLGSAQP